MNKRIVFIFRDLGTGGAQKIEAFVANALYVKDYDIIAINMASTLCTVNLNPNINIVNVSYDSVEHCNNKIVKFLLKIKYLIKLRKTIFYLKPDLVISFLSDVVRVTVLSLFGSKIKIIGSERGDPFAFTKRQLNNYKKAYNKCSGVVFQLPYVKKIYNLPISIKQVVVPNPCIPRNHSFPEWLDKGNHIIVSAGRLCQQKRFDLLISAFDKVCKNHSEYKLIIYGEGPLRKELQEQINNCEYAKNSISLSGDVKDVFELAKSAEFFVLSSDFEGIPNVLMEAMAIGMPCISTDCSPGGARFLLKNGECGLLCPCGDVEKLAKAIQKYIEEPSLRLSYAQKAMYVKNDFDSQSISNQWLEFIEAIIG